MTLNQDTKLLRSTAGQLAVLLLLMAAAQFTVYSQGKSKAATLRGTAKVNGTIVVEGVMVVVVPPRNGRGMGKPVPAKVSNTGEYRIEDIVAGSYELRAVGGAIKEVIQPVVIEPGNSNIVHLKLQRAERRTKVRGRILDDENRTLPHQKIQIFSSQLPPSICPDCILHETKSNEHGEVSYDDVASDESYSFVVKMEDKTTSDVTLIASEPMAIGSGEQTRLEFKIGAGAKPVLTASLLMDAPPPGMVRDAKDQTAFFWMLDQKRYETRKTGTVKFLGDTADLSIDSKRILDGIAREVGDTSSYFVAIGALPDSMESFQPAYAFNNFQTKAIVRYLSDTHQIPVEKIMFSSRDFSMPRQAAATSHDQAFRVLLLVNDGRQNRIRKQ